MLWVCRAGQGAKYENYFKENSKIYLPWIGYKLDFSTIESLEEFKKIVVKEKGNVNRVSISNWASQLMLFCKTIQINDYVLIPSKGSKTYCLAKVVSDYQYDEMNENDLYHSRQIVYLGDEVSKEVFPKEIQYSLGAYRTIFRPKNEEIIINMGQSFFLCDSSAADPAA